MTHGLPRFPLFLFQRMSFFARVNYALKPVQTKDQSWWVPYPENPFCLFVRSIWSLESIILGKKGLRFTRYWSTLLLAASSTREKGARTECFKNKKRLICFDREEKSLAAEVPENTSWNYLLGQACGCLSEDDTSTPNCQFLPFQYLHELTVQKRTMTSAIPPVFHYVSKALKGIIFWSGFWF